MFYDALGAGNEKYVAEAISHEAGHNMGLLHDGTSSTGYYTGQGSGATGWAPIMGVGYYSRWSQWSKGEYAGANNVQDDYVVMQGNGLPIRLDDHGDSIWHSDAAAAVTRQWRHVPGRRGRDRTAQRHRRVPFTGGPGTITVTVNPAARSPNLDLLGRAARQPPATCWRAPTRSMPCPRH